METVVWSFARKKHQNLCKFFSIFGSCKFGADCAYTHIKSKIENNIEKLTKEIEHLKRKGDELMKEKAVNDLEQNIERLKIRINDLKNQNEKK